MMGVDALNAWGIAKERLSQGVEAEAIFHFLGVPTLHYSIFFLKKTRMGI